MATNKRDDRRPVYVGSDGKIYDVAKDDRIPVRIGKDGQIYNVHSQRRIPVIVGKDGHLYSPGQEKKIPVYLGQNGELYPSRREAQKYGSTPSKMDKDKKPVRVDKEGHIIEIVSGIISIASILILAIVFILPTPTANVIGSNASPRIFGVILLVIGLIASYFFVRQKKALKP